jgi:hypothetical protein
MPINSGTFGKALWPGVNKWYGDAYAEWPVEWDKIFKKESSRKAFEEDVGLSGFGLMTQKGEGIPVTYDTMKTAFVDRYQHVEYGLGFIITKALIEDDLYDVVGKKRAQGLAFSVRQTKEIVCANVLNRAFNTSYLFGDGKALCVSDHPNASGGTWSNVIATAADLSEASLEQACIDIMGFTDDRGKRIAVLPQKLVVPYQQTFEADKIMQTQYEVGTDNNTVNVVRSKFPGGVIVNHYLTDNDAWFVLTNVNDGMKMFERRADTFSQDDDFDTDNAKFKVTNRFSVGCTDKRAIYGSAGA